MTCSVNEIAAAWQVSMERFGSQCDQVQNHKKRAYLLMQHSWLERVVLSSSWIVETSFVRTWLCGVPLTCYPAGVEQLASWIIPDQLPCLIVIGYPQQIIFSKSYLYSPISYCYCNSIIFLNIKTTSKLFFSSEDDLRF